MSNAQLERNPKILHRIYFTNFAPYQDPFEHYLESWHEQMPGYKVMHWNMSNLDVFENAWTKKAFEQKAPVFLAEYFRWKILYEHGGLYLDADCEILNGKTLNNIIEELYGQDNYDVFFGVEEQANGHPTAQTCGAKKGSELALYMMSMYENSLAPLWAWRESRGLIGPQLMALYFLEKNENVATDGFFKNIIYPVTVARAKVYPQTYFSPKFSLLGDALDFDEEKTCVYHLFANSNVDFSKNKREEKARRLALKFHEYRDELNKQSPFPRFYDGSHFSTRVGQHTEVSIIWKDGNGVMLYGPYVSLPAGNYKAKLVCKKYPNRGSGTFSVTADIGKSTLASKTIIFNSKNTSGLEVPFSIDQAVSTDMEFVLSVENIDFMEIEGVTVERGDNISAIPAPSKLKILHRVYFGFDGKPDQFARYLETWGEQLPEFQIMKWDASNLPMDINPYVSKLYEEKDHAFLTDFFRWYLLREYGGTYLDADVEIVDGRIYRQLIEELEVSEDFDALIGVDERGGGWYTAHSMASKPDSEISRFMCEVYTNFGSFAAWRKKGMYFWAPQLAALYFANMGHNVGGMGTSPNLVGPDVKARVKIYPQDWFSPLSPTGDPRAPFALNGISNNTCLCHHFACSWHESDSIYLEHSKKRGGQASVLLSDLIIEARRKNYSVGLDAMQTHVGVKHQTGISTQGKSGFLAYGPYSTLQAGDYAVTFCFKHIRSIVGAKVDVVSNFGEDILTEKFLSGDLQGGMVTLNFTVDQPLNAVEFRVNVGHSTDFELSEIRLKQS